jgi:hypothetical protein
MCFTRACTHYVVGATFTYWYQDLHVTRVITRVSLLNLLLSILMNCMIRCFALSCAWIFKRWESEKNKKNEKIVSKYTTNERGPPRACEVCETFTHLGPKVGH